MSLLQVCRSNAFFCVTVKWWIDIENKEHMTVYQSSLAVHCWLMEGRPERGVSSVSPHCWIWANRRNTKGDAQPEAAGFQQSETQILCKGTWWWEENLSSRTSGRLDGSHQIQHNVPAYKHDIQTATVQHSDICTVSKEFFDINKVIQRRCRE